MSTPTPTATVPYSGLQKSWYRNHFNDVIYWFITETPEKTVVETETLNLDGNPIEPVT